MSVATLFVMVGMLQGTPAAPQAMDSTPPPDSGLPLGARTVLRRSMLQQLPIDDPREALTLVPGLVRRGPSLGIGAGSGIRLRGGSPDGAAVYVDGAPVRSLLTGVQGLTLGSLAIDEIVATRGPTDVALADGAGGGVIEYITPGGDRRFDGQVVAASDAFFNRLAARAGGPAGPRASWFFAGEVTGQQSAYRGSGARDQPAFVWGGVDTVVSGVAVPTFIESTGRKRPLDWITERRGLGKVTVRIGGGSVAVTGLISDLQQRFFPGSNIGDTALFSGARTSSRLAVANWTQPLRSGAVHVVVSLGHDGASAGLLTATSQSGSADPRLGIAWSSLSFLGSDSIPRTTEQIVRNVRSNAGLRTPFLGQTSLRNAQSYRLNPYGLATGWPTSGSDGPLTNLGENRFDGRAWLDWRFTPRNHVRVGVDYTRARDDFYRSDLVTQTDLDAWIARPRRMGAFAADRVTWERLTVEVGARFDHFTPGGALPLVPGRIFTNPAWNVASGTDDTAYSASVARVFREATGRSAISPRLSAAYTVSSRATLRLDAGQVVEAPSVAEVFGGSNSDLAFTNLFTTRFGRDVRYLKSTTGDIGVSARVIPQLDVDIDAYVSRLALYWTTIAPFDDPANPGRTLNLFVLSPVDSIWAHGIEGSLDWRPGADGAARVAYSWDRRGGVSTQALEVMARYSSGPARGDLSATASLRAQSGVAYVPLTNVGAGTAVFESNADFLGPLATGRLPWTKTLDLRIGKRLGFSHVSGTVYADLRDALNLRNVIGVFTETGTATNALFQTNALSPEFTNLHIEAQANGTLLAGNAIDLRPDCSTWTGTTSGPVDCAALRLVERRFGNGDGVYDLTEQTAAFNAYYEAFFGAAQFYAPGRAVRIGVELTF